MCHFLSAIYLANGELIHFKNCHSHSETAILAGIRDAQNEFQRAPYAKLELSPWMRKEVSKGKFNSCVDFSTWRWRIEGERPEWFDSACERDARVKMETLLHREYLFSEGEHVFQGNVWAVIYGNAKAEINDMQEGRVWLYENSLAVVNRQRDGRIDFNDDSCGTLNDQIDGVVRFNNPLSSSARHVINNQKGGDVFSWHLPLSHRKD